MPGFPAFEIYGCQLACLVASLLGEPSGHEYRIATCFYAMEIGSDTEANGFTLFQYEPIASDS